MNGIQQSRIFALCLPAALLFGCGGSGGGGGSRAARVEPIGEALGGDTTVFTSTAEAFSQPAANLSTQRQDDFFAGNALFNRTWVTAPSSTEGIDGLGPLFNAASCSACHFRDGRGRPPLDASEPAVSILFRVSTPGSGPHGAPLPDPVYGDQLQPHAVLGVPAEGEVAITYEFIDGLFPDGSPFQLRSPRYEVVNLSFGPLADGFQLSPRVAQAVIGMGLLEAIPVEAILDSSDELDLDQDGISGRPNYVANARLGELALGRFGWKANQPTVEQQTAGAFLGDIGITSEIFPVENCTQAQSDCASAPNGGAPELTADKLERVTFYLKTLGVPARRGAFEADVEHGEKLFRSAGCNSCHAETWVTGEVAGFPELSGQVIHPFTDLLLHDMGDGLADGRQDFSATGNEWRTPPLWGLGLLPVVSDHTFLLHDGRARGIAEAILWHGGEAEASRERFKQLKRTDRQSLLKFLESL